MSFFFTPHLRLFKSVEEKWAWHEGRALEAWQLLRDMAFPHGVRKIRRKRRAAAEKRGRHLYLSPTPPALLYVAFHGSV